MRNAQADAAITLIEKIFLVKQINDIERNHELLIFWQQNDMRQREIVRGVRIEVRAIRLGSGIDRRSQPRPIEHLSCDGRMLAKTIAQHGRTGHELRMIAEDAPS
jgi:hypothetical protein